MRNETTVVESARPMTAAFIGAAIFSGLYLTSLYSYALFHSLAELFSIVVAGCVFIIFWNARRFMNDACFAIIAVACLFVAFIDMTHMLAYKGMGVFPARRDDLATQLWIGARYIQALSLLLAPLLLHRKLDIRLLITGYGAVTALLFSTIFYWEVFPACFVEGVGLTVFKKASEYIICLLLVAAVAAFAIKRREFDRRVLRLLVAGIVATILSEVAFTLYTDLHGLSNQAGHYLKIIAFFLLYKALVEMSLRKPFAILFKDLKEDQEALETRVEERTAELRQSNEDLLESEARFRTLVDSAPERGTMFRVLLPAGPEDEC